MGKKFCLEIQDKIAELGFLIVIWDFLSLFYLFIFYFFKVLSIQFQNI